MFSRVSNPMHVTTLACFNLNSEIMRLQAACCQRQERKEVVMILTVSRGLCSVVEQCLRGACQVD